MAGSRQGFERGVFGEIRAGLLDLGQLRAGRQVLDDPPRAENGAHLAGLVRVAGGEQKVLS